MTDLSGSDLAAYYRNTVADPTAVGTANSLAQQQRLAARFKLVLAQMPDLAKNPQAALQLAQSPYSDADLAGHTAAAGAATDLDSFLGVLKSSSPAAQRMLYSQLTQQQQAAAAQLGYKPPDRSEGSWFSGILSPIAGPVGEAIGGALHAGETAVGTVAGPALEGLRWVADQPAHLYRAIATDPSANLGAVLGGAALGATGVALAPFTGGLSLGLTAAAIGGGGLLGATAGAAVSNPSDWFDAFQGSWDGEKTFKLDAQRQARGLLSDDRLTNLAKDVAWGTDQPSLYELASSLAGTADALDPNTYDKGIQRLADRTFTPGTPQHDTFYGQLRDLVTDPTFKRAVDTLQQGKISPGRDLTSAIGLDPSQGWGRFVSGATDALWVVTLDPTLAVARASEAYRVARYGLKALDSDGIVAKMTSLYGQDPGWTRTVDLLADTATRGAEGFEDLRNKAPQLQPMFDKVVDWARANNLDTVSGHDVLDWLTDNNQLSDLIVGKAARPGEVRMLPRITRTGQVWSNVKSVMGTVIDATNDADMEKMTEKILAEANKGIDFGPPTDPKLLANLGYSAGITPAEPGMLYSAVHGVASLPGLGYPLRKVGTLVSGLTSLAPTRDAISLVGPDAAAEIDRFTDLFRTSGMPSLTRDAWRDFILAQQNDGQRLNAITQFMDNAMRQAGIDQVEGGENLIARFRDHVNQAYFLGSDATADTPIGKMPVGQLVTLDQAYDLPIPNVQELRKAAMKSGIMHDLLNVVDTPLIDTTMQRVWKPSVLLRIGFIPRVAGDELLAFIARNGIGSYAKTFAERAVGQGEEHADLAAKAAAGGVDALSEAEQLKLDRWRYLAHVRPLERIANRVGFGSSFADQVLGSYTDFVRSTLKQGFAPNLVEGLSPRLRMLVSPEGSTRDLFFHGMSPDVVDAAKAWSHYAGDRIMAHVSSNRTGPWDNQWTGNNYGQMVRTWDPRSGEIQDQMMLPLRGQFERKYIEKDPTFMSALHSQYSKYVEDPFQAPVVRDFFTHYLPEGLNESDVRVAHQALSQIGDPAVRQILVETQTGEPNQRIVRNLVSRIRDDNVREAIYANLPLGDMDSEGIVKAVQNGLKQSGRAVQARKLTPLTGLQIDPSVQRQFGLLLHAHQGGELPTEWKTADQFLEHLQTGLAEQARDPAWTGQLTRSHYVHTSPSGLPVANAPARGTTRMYLATADPTTFTGLMQSAANPQNIYANVYEHLVRGLQQIESPALDHLDHLDAFANAMAHLGPATWDEMIRNANEAGHGVTPITAMAFSDPQIAQDVSRVMQTPWQAGEIPAESAHYAYVDMPHDVLRFRDGELYGVNKPMVDNGKRAWILNSDAVTYRAQIVPMGTPLVRTTRGPINALTMDQMRAEAATHPEMLYHGTDTAWYDEHPKPGFAEGSPGSINGPGLYVTDQPDVAYDYGRADFEPANPSTRTYRLELTDPHAKFLSDADPRAADHIADAIEKVAGRAQSDAYMRIVTDEGQPPIRAYRAWLDDISENVGDPTDPGRVMSHAVPKALHEDGWTGFEYQGGALSGGQPHNAKVIWDPEDVWVDALTGDGMKIPFGPKVPGISYEDAVQERMDGLAHKIDQLFRANLREDRVVPTKAMELGYDEMGAQTRQLHSGIYNHEGQQLDAGAVMNEDPAQGFRDEAGNFVDPREIPWEYRLRDNGDKRILHEIISPMVMDSMDDEKGYKTFEQGSRVLRSQVKHVIDSSGTDLPNVALGPVYTQIKGNSFWDRMVRFGFNRVIGPAVDAIIRKPMAFHNFQIAYRDGMASLDWLRNPELLDAVGRIAPELDKQTQGALIRFANRQAGAANEGEIADMGDVNHWLRGLGTTPQDATQELAKRANQLRAAGKDKLAEENLTLQSYMPHIWPDSTASTGDQFLQAWRDIMPKAMQNRIPSEWSVAQQTEARNLFPPSVHAVVSNDDNHKLLQAASTELDNLTTHVRDRAMEQAVDMTMPFIHSHQFRSQFADQARPFLPFQFAEENMIKRWARTARVAPNLVEKARLGYDGLKSGGVIQTDANGTDWFVYPGSGLLTEALGHVPGFGSVLGTGVLMKAQPNAMLPGLQEFGAPRATPLVSIPLSLVGSQFPDLKPVQDALLGQSGTNKGVLRAFFPSSVVNMVDAFTADDSNGKYAAAMMAAAKILQANGEGLPENATDLDVQDFLRKLRGHARTLLVAQALTGFLTPGSPTIAQTGQPGSLAAQLSGVGVDDPAGVMDADYLAMVRNMGIQAGTAQYLKEHPNADPWQSYNTLALSEPNTKTPSGARIPITQGSIDFYNANKQWIDSMPNAGAWFIPPAHPGDSTDQIDRNAYDEQLANDLRVRQTPEEFIRSMYFKVAAQPYFTASDSYKYTLAQAKTQAQKRTITATWNRYQQEFLAAHPLFATELQTGTGSQRRQETIKEMRVAVNDPQAPTAWHTEALKTLQDSWDQYNALATMYGADRKKSSQRNLDALKIEFDHWVNAYTLTHPEVEGYWSSVLKPESNLPDAIPAESAA